MSRTPETTVEPNYTLAESFLESLAGPSWREEVFTFQTVDDDADRERARRESARASKKKPGDGPLARVRSGKWEDQKTWLTTMNLNGAGVYVTVNKTGGDGRKIENIKELRAIWCEWDRPGALPRWPIEPHMIVETSPGHFHIYWMSDPLMWAEFTDLMAVMVLRYGSDPGAKDASRVLRLPGFYHRKVDSKKDLTGTPHLVNIVENNDLVRYEPETLFDTFEVAKYREERDAKERDRETKRKPRGRPTKKTFDEAAVREALKFISCEPRETWRTIGMALASTRDTRAFDIWDAWSSSSPKYDVEDQYRTWNSFREVKGEYEGGVTLGTLFKLAKDGGYQAGELDGASAAGGDRPIIKYTPGKLPRNLDEAEAALLRDEHERIYQRGSMLVRTARIPEPGVIRSVRRSAGALGINAMDKPYLIERATASACWKAFNKKTGEWASINCPADIAEGLLSRSGRWRFPVLTAITESPTLLADGRVLDSPGYSKESGILFDPGATVFPPLEQAPSREHARAALLVLVNLIRRFPFVTKTDRSVALSAILTPLCRLAVRSAPLFGFSAPTMGTGKSLLADLVALISTGRRAAVTSHSVDPAEERKKLLAVLIQGDPIIMIDNVSETWGSDAMCAILTSETYKERLLGVSKIVTVPTCATWLATGNNLAFRDDLSTRTLLSCLDAKCEKPEERAFDRDLLEWVPEHRGALVTAGLTVLRAYITAGRPKVKLQPFGRFEQWSDLVRSSLVWLGQADPCKSRERIERADPVREALSAMLSAWRERFGDEAETVPRAVDVGGEDLRAVFMQVAGEKSAVNTRRLGNWISKHQDRIVSGLRFERFGERQGFALWRVLD